jgi:hypothetical protein
MGELAGDEREGKGRGRGEAAGGAMGGMGRGCYWRRGLGPCCSLRLFSVRSLCLREEESMEREERKEKKRREGKKRNKKNGENFKHANFQKKIKDNLRSWSKITF